MLASITSYLLTKARSRDAQQALSWLTGSLNGRGWEHVRSLAITLVVLAPLTAFARAPAAHVCSSATTTAHGLGAAGRALAARR